MSRQFPPDIRSPPTASTGYLLESDNISPLNVETILDPQTFISPSEQTSGTMAFFTQHHFSPGWTSPHRAHINVPTTVVPPPHVAPSAPAPPKSEHDPTDPTKLKVQHHVPGHDAFSRFLHAFNSHNGSEEHDVVHPHFDLVETKTCYAVYGELPGLTQQDVAVEANDHLFTLTISGELKRPAPQAVEGAPPATDAEGVGIAHDESKPGASAEQTQPQPAEDMEATTTEPNKPANEEAKKQQEEPAKPEEKAEADVHWHVTERRVGHFKRVFHFPVELVEMSAIKASMHHGLICAIVPKRKDLEGYNKKVENSRKVDIHLSDAFPLYYF